MMKKILVALLVLAFNAGIAQRLAYIEIEKIINQLPEYKKANETIDAQIDQWETEVETKFESVENLYQEYVKNERMFSDDVKLQKQDEIRDAEKQAKEFREQKFGKEGELTKLKEQQLNPLQDNIFKAAEKVAKANNYDYVFDKSPETNWIYVNPEHNITEKVLAELGIKQE
jgi:outer membrane protein